MRNLGVLSSPGERIRLGFAGWWRMQRKDRPVFAVRRLEERERGHEERSCVLHQIAETSRQVSMCRRSGCQRQCLDSVERLLRQIGVRCRWQDKDVSVGRVFLGDLHQGTWWASKVMRTSRAVSSVVRARCLTPGKAGWTDQVAGETRDSARLSSSSCRWTAFLCPCSPSLQPLNPTQRSRSWGPVKRQCQQMLWRVLGPGCSCFSKAHLGLQSLLFI